MCIACDFPNLNGRPMPLSLSEEQQTTLALEAVAQERKVQRGRFGNSNDDKPTPYHWVTLLEAYIGRAAIGLMHRMPPPTEEAELRQVPIDDEELRTTIVKVAAIATAWIEAIDRAAKQ